MRCPKCGCSDDKVIDSRSVKDGFGIRRRRECISCNYRFTTLESVSPEELKVVKRDGSREDFDPEKLRRGIDHACYKRNVSFGEIDRIVGEVSSSLQRDFNKEVPSAEIGNRVMEALRLVDEVAFVRFASVYRKFTDAADFIQEIQELKK
ncbi:MAG: transcriptional repressor NrdR [Lentisphaerae bacterium]|nr:transcriptional repressor NrdR [Lentisphaerota bacterium]MBQ9804019.1 transcriptional repressor NrdR [Lentisphaeria bacterium]